MSVDFLTITVDQERKLILIEKLLRKVVLEEDTLTGSERAGYWNTILRYKTEYLKNLKGDETHLDTISSMILEEKEKLDFTQNEMEKL